MRKNLLKYLILAAGAYAVGYYGLKFLETQRPTEQRQGLPSPQPPNAPVPVDFGVQPDLCALFGGGGFCYQPSSLRG